MYSIILEQHANYSRYFGDKDIEGMFATLGPLHDLLANVSSSSAPLSHLFLTVSRERKHFEKYPLLNLLGGTWGTLSTGATFTARLAKMVI